MKRAMQVGAAALLLLSFTGCVALQVPQRSNGERRLRSETQTIIQAAISGVVPSIVKGDGVVNINVNLSGTFDIERKKIYAGSSGADEYIAVGLFPGVMSCRGEYRNSLQNGTVAFFYNLYFAGLPTVYGLLVEPFIPHYPQQTDSIVGQTAFLKSTLFGFSRYSKPAYYHDDQEISHSTVNSVRLEDAIISAPGLGLESYRGQALQIPVDMLPEGGDVIVKLNLPAEHPLKSAMSDFEDVEITIQCK